MLNMTVPEIRRNTMEYGYPAIAKVYLVWFIVIINFLNFVTKHE